MVHSAVGTQVALWSEKGRAMVDSILSLPTKFNRAETFTILGFLIAGISGVVWTNFELGAIRERGVAVRLRLDKLEAGRDDIIRVQEQLKGVALSLDKLDRKLDRIEAQPNR